MKTKHRLSLLAPLVLLLALFICAPTAQADQYTSGTAQGVVAGKTVTFTTQIWPSHIKATYDGMTYTKQNDENWYQLYDYYSADPSKTSLVFADSINGIPVRYADSFMVSGTGGKALTHITLGANMEEIQYYFGGEIPNLKEISIPSQNKLSKIVSGAFFENPKLQRIGIGTTNKLPSSLTLIGSYAFDRTALSSIDLSATGMTSIDECVFSNCSSLKSIKLPPQLDYIGPAAFSSCLSLTAIDIPKNVFCIDFGAFEHCTSLDSIILRGGFPEGKGVLPGTGTRCFFDISPNAVVQIPRLNNTKAYEDALSNLYSASRGSAPACVDLRYIGSSSGQTAPQKVRVDSSSLDALAQIDGLQVDTGKAASDLGCAAIVTVTGNAGGANLKALATSYADNIYWDYAKAYCNELGMHSITQKTYTGAALTRSMYAGANHHSENAPSASLTRSLQDPRSGFYFYFPIATNTGTYSRPETSAIGQPVLVIYKPDEQFLPKLAMDSTNPSYETGMNWGEPRAENAGPLVTAPGFETLFPTLPNRGDPARTADGSSSMTYQWYYSKDQTIGNGDDTPIPNSSGDLSYYGYVRSGMTDDILWSIAYADDAFRQNLPVGLHTLYAKVTMTVATPTDEKSTSIYSNPHHFYRYDMDELESCVRLRADGNVTPHESRENNFWADRNTDVYVEAYFDYSSLSVEKASGYRELEQFIESYYMSQQFSDGNHSIHTGRSDLTQDDKRSYMKLNTELLEGDYHANIQDGKADEVYLYAGVHYRFPMDRTTYFESAQSNYVGLYASGKTAPQRDPFFSESTIFRWNSIRAENWKPMLPLDPSVTEQSIKDGTLEFYRVSAPEQNRGGTLLYTADWSRDQIIIDSQTDPVQNRSRIQLKKPLSLTSGPTYFYARFTASDGTKSYSPTLTIYTPYGGERYQHTLGTPSPEDIYLGPTSKQRINFPITLQDEFMPTTVSVECSTDRYADDAAWAAMPPEDYRPAHGLALTAKPSIINGLMVTDSTMHLDLQRVKNGNDLFETYANGRDSVFVRLRITFPNTAQYHEDIVTSSVLVKKSAADMALDMIIKQGAETLTGLNFSMDQKSPAPMVISVRHDRSDQNITWEIESNYTSGTTLSQSSPNLSFGYDSKKNITTTYTPNASILTIPIPDDNVPRVLHISARSANTDETIGASCPRFTVRLNPKEYAEEPSVARGWVGDLYYLPGTTKDLPELTASASVSDGGHLSWQWYRCQDQYGNGATPINGASGTGKSAVWKLSAEDLAKPISFYYFCRFTNTNPAATVEQTTFKDTSAQLLMVDENLSSAGTPTFSPQSTYLYSYFQGTQTPPAEPFRIVADKPAGLKNVPGGEGPFTVNQTAVFHFDILDLDTGETQESFLFDADVTCTEENGKYIYTVDPNDVVNYGIASGVDTMPDDFVFTTHWTITNYIEGSDYPTNLATGAERISADSASSFLYRYPMNAPTLKPVQPGVSDDVIRFQEGAPTGTAEFDGKTVRTHSCYNGAAGVSLRPFFCDIESDANADLTVIIEDYNPETKEWETNCFIGSPDPNGYYAYFNREAGETEFLRLAVYAQLNDTTGSTIAQSKTVYSEVFGLTKVTDADHPTHAEEPKAPASLYGPYIWDKNDPPASVTLMPDPWTVSDGGTISYAWTYYDEAIGRYVDIIGTQPGLSVDPVTGSLTVSADFPALAAALEQERSITFHVTAANTNPKCTGLWSVEKDASLSLRCGTVAAAPEFTVTSDQAYTEYFSGKDPSPMLSIAIANKDACGSLSPYMMQQIVSLDGTPVKDGYINSTWFDSSSSVSVCYWHSSLHLDEDTSYYIDQDFWKTHSELKLKVWIEVRNYDSAATAHREVTTASEPMYFTVKRAEVPDSPVTVTCKDADGKVLSTAADPGTVPFPEGGSVTFSVPERPNESYDWKTSADGIHFQDANVYTPTLTYTEENRALWENHPYISCTVSHDSKATDTTYAVVTTKELRITLFDAEQARTPVIHGSSNPYADPGTTAVLSAAAKSPDDGTLSYQWYEKSGSGWKKLDGETKETLSVTAPADMGHYNSWKAVVTNTNPKCAVTTASAEQTYTLNVRGLRILLPETIPPAVENQSYRMSFRVEAISESGYSEEKLTGPAGYGINYRNGLFHLGRDQATAVSNGTIKMTAMMDGKLYTTESEPFSIQLQPLAIKSPEITHPTVSTLENQAVASPTVLGNDGGKALTWSLSGAPGWLAIDKKTGAITASDTPAEPGWHTVTLSVTNGTASASLPLRIGLAADSEFYLYEQSGNSNYLGSTDQSGPGWSWDGGIRVLTLNNFSGDSLSSPHRQDLYIRLIGTNTLSSSSSVTISNIKHLTLKAESPASLYLESSGQKSATALDCTALTMDEAVTLNAKTISSEYSRAVSPSDGVLEVYGGGTLHAEAHYAGRHNVSSTYAVDGSLAVYGSTDISLLTEGPASFVLGVNGRFETHGTGDISIRAISENVSGELYGVRSANSSIGHTGGTVSIETVSSAPVSSNRRAMCSPITVDESRYEIIGSPDSSAVSYRAVSSAEAPILSPSGDMTLALSGSAALETVSGTAFRASSMETVTWSAENLPKGVTLVPNGNRAQLTGTPEEIGTFHAVIRARNAAGTGTVNVTLLIRDTVLSTKTVDSQRYTLSKGSIFLPAKMPSQDSGHTLDLTFSGKTPASITAAATGAMTAVMDEDFTGDPTFRVHLYTSKCTAGETGTITFTALNAEKKALGELVLPYTIIPDSAPHSMHILNHFYDNMKITDYSGPGWAWDHATGILTFDNLRARVETDHVVDCRGSDLHILYKNKNVLDSPYYIPFRTSGSLLLKGVPGAQLILESPHRAAAFDTDLTFQGGNVSIHTETLHNGASLTLRDLESFSMRTKTAENNPMVIDNTDPAALYAQAGDINSTLYAYAGTIFPVLFRQDLADTTVTEGSMRTLTVAAPSFTASDGGTIAPEYQWYCGTKAIPDATGSSYAVKAEDIGAAGSSASYHCTVTYPAYKTIASASGDSSTCTVTVETEGHSITGQVTSYNPSNPVQIELKQGTEVKYTAVTETGTSGETITQSFTLPKVADGTYDLVLTKAGHLVTTIQGVSVSGSNVDLTASANPAVSSITMIAGDLNEDGMVNSGDVNVIYQSDNYLKSTAEAATSAADLNGDGMINSGDINIIYQSNHYLKTKEDCTYTM